jgi:uncharacterized RDD family membrane protein YckC
VTWTRSSGLTGVLTAAMMCLCAAAVGDSGDEGSFNLDEMLLAGSDQGVWLVRRHRRDKAAVFDVVVRPSGQEWRWVLRDTTGRPAAAAAMGLRLHLLSDPPTTYQIIATPDSGTARITPAPRPDDPNWPANSTAVAACTVPPFAQSKLPGVIAIVTPVHQPLSGPRSTGRPSRMDVFQTVAGKWTHLPELAITLPKNATRTPDARVSVAATGDSQQAFVLVAGRTAAGSYLAAWKDGAWKPLQLPAAPERPVAVRLVQGQVVLVTAIPLAGIAIADKSRNPAYHIQMRVIDTQGPADEAQLITKGLQDTQPLLVSGKSPPLTVSLGVSDGKLALLWWDGQAIQFAMCGLSGGLITQGSVDVFTQPPPGLSGQDVWQYFLWGILMATLGATLLGRGGRTIHGPFVLPAYLVTGALPRRGLAAVIDLLPFLVLSGIAAQIALPMSPAEQKQLLTAVMDQQSPVPFELAWCLIGVLLLYVVYGTVMEVKFGATLGKMVVKLRVIASEGRPPTVWAAAMRNLLKLVELFSWPPIAPVLMLIPMITRTRQRLGDMLARTTVVEAIEKPLHGPPDLPTNPEEKETHDNPEE